MIYQFNEAVLQNVEVLQKAVVKVLERDTHPEPIQYKGVLVKIILHTLQPRTIMKFAITFYAHGARHFISITEVIYKTTMLLPQLTMDCFKSLELNYLPRVCKITIHK